jgi:hypothetical protein
MLTLLATTVLVVLVDIALAQPQRDVIWPDSLRTVAERSNYERTARHEEVVSLLDALSSSSGFTARVAMGTSTEGREIPMLVLASPAVRTGQEARELSLATGRPIILLIGNIHAGEVDGKEALPMLARDVLHGPERALLDRAILIIAPIYNPDGNERMKAGQRPGQNGPAETGIRENARGRDLNRDFMKAEEAETQALLGIFREFDPHVFIDCHVTNGSYHRYVVTYGGPRGPGGDAQLNHFATTRMLPGIDEAFEASTGKHAFWYGSFEGEFGDAERGHTRWESYPAEPRFGTTYVGLRNRLSVLIESYTYAPFEERVQATKAFALESIRWTAQHANEVITLTQEADRRTSDLAEHTDDSGDVVGIVSRPMAQPAKAKILGFEEETVDGRSRSTGRPAEYEVDLMDRFEATVSVVRPWGYAIPVGTEFDVAIEVLHHHGIQVNTTAYDMPVPIEEYRVTAAKPASREFQGHVLVRCEVEAVRGHRTLPAGTRLVPMAQPLGNLVAALLEPHAEDSLATWNHFDRWMKAGETYPVIRVMDRPERP